MTVTTLDRKIRELNEPMRHVLCLIAYCGNEISSTIVVNYVKEKYDSSFTYDGLLTNELMKDFCSFTDSFSFAFKPIEIDFMWFFPTLKYLIKEHAEWIKEFDAFLAQHRVRPTKINLMFREWIIAWLTNKQLPSGSEFESRNENIFHLYFWPLVFDEELQPLLVFYPSVSLIKLVSLAIRKAVSADIFDEERALSKLSTVYPFFSGSQQKVLAEMVAFYDYVAFGEYNPSEGGNSVYFFLLEAIQALHHKQYERTREMFAEAIRLNNKTSDNKNVFNNFLTNYFLFAYYICQPTAENQVKMNQLNRLKEAESFADLLPALIMVRNSFKKKCDKTLLDVLKELASTFTYRTYLLVAPVFSTIYQSSDATNEPFAISYTNPQLFILRHEFQHFLPLSQEELDALNASYGKPVFLLGKSGLSWELQLSRVSDMCESMARGTGDVFRMERLCYMIDDCNVVIREQKRMQNGVWSSGKDISRGSYVWSEPSSMNDQDRMIWQMNGKNLVNLKIETVLPYLIGSDRVFVGKKPPFVPAVVEEEKPYLIVVKESDGFVISSNLPDKANSLEYVVRKDYTHFHVIQLTAQERELYKLLFSIGKLPLQAEDRFCRVLKQVSQYIEVHSSLLDQDFSSDPLEGSGQVVIQIAPDKFDFYDVELKVQPLSGGKETFCPGDGPEIFIDMTPEGRFVQVKRQLEQERCHFEVVSQFIESLYDAGKMAVQGGMGTTWKLFLPGVCDLLEFVGKHFDEYVIAWPEGKKLSVKQVMKSDDWKLQVKNDSNWFEIEGEVKLDDGSMLDISQLLQKVHDNNGRKFVQLSESEYLLLSDSVKRQLMNLDALSLCINDKVRIPSFSALFLSESIKGDIPIQSAEALSEMVSKIKHSYTLKPDQPDGLQATLRNYQLDGFRWMVALDSWGSGACLADDMGLGKTVQTIAFLLYKQSIGPSLILAPTSVVTNWQMELARFAPTLQVSLLNEMGSEERTKVITKAEAGQVLIVSYGIVCAEAELMGAKEWNVVCLDEAHVIKNRETKTAQTVYELKSKTRIALTGTPLQNHLGELWSLFNFINPGMLGSYTDFYTKYESPIGNGDKERQMQLRKVILPFILRRTKKEVVTELPDKTDIVLEIRLSAEEMSLYEVIRNRAKARLEQDRRASISVLAEITKLRQAACAPWLVDSNLRLASTKLEQVMGLVSEILSKENRILIFSQFTSFLSMVRKRLDENGMEYLYIDGNTSLKKRAKMVEDFQNGECGIFVISLKAGGLGLNLTNANYVIHMDPWWNPAIEQQATDRAYRIGQEQKVTVYHLIAKHTIEEKILRMHKKKQDMADSLLEGADVGHKLTEEDLRELIG